VAIERANVFKDKRVISEKSSLFNSQARNLRCREKAGPALTGQVAVDEYSTPQPVPDYQVVWRCHNAGR